MKRNIRIVGSGKYLPRNAITAAPLDEQLGLPNGWVEKKSGVKVRHFVTDEVNSDMAVKAIEQALQHANMKKEQLDCIISTSASFDQPLPCMASLIKEKMNFTNHPIPAFDVDSTCLSFVVALDIVSYMMEANRFQNVVIVASEIASLAINPKTPESYSIFGDGAAAVIISRSNEYSSHIKTALLETYPEGAHMTEVRGGGAILHARHHNETNKEEYLFTMDGRAVFKLSSRLIHGFMDRLFEGTNMTMEDVDIVVPHQASAMAMRLMRKKLDIPEQKFIDIIENHGNTIAASIPMALHEAIVSGRIQRGDKVLLLGTSAGLSIGGLLLEY